MPYGTKFTHFNNTFNHGAPGGKPPRKVEKLNAAGDVVETFGSIKLGSASLGKKYGAYMDYIITSNRVVDGFSYRYKSQ